MSTLKTVGTACWGGLQWLLPVGRLHVLSGLNIRNLEPFVHTSELSPPNINIDSRCRLELLSEYPLGGHLPGFSQTNLRLTQMVFRSLVRTSQYTAKFPMSKLHGVAASKCLHSPERASQPNMAKMGELVNDLPDLEDSTGQELIDRCMQWGQLRLDEGIHLVTDTWHRRYYWRNSGGGHHMSVLCRELQAQSKEWTPEVTITEFSVDMAAMDRLNGKVDVYMTMIQPDRWGLHQVFEPLHPLLDHDSELTKLGLSVPIQNTTMNSFGQYQLTFVDHSRPFARIVNSKLKQAVDEGLALNLKDYLASWINHGCATSAIHSRILP